MKARASDVTYVDVPRYRLSLVREEGTTYASDGVCLERPAELAAWLWERAFSDAPEERTCAVYLDVRLRVLGWSILTVGSISRAIVEPRQAIVPGLLCLASSFVFAHNHPSGDPSPSAEDLRATERLAEAGKVTGLTLLDHLIVAGPERFTSLRQSGALHGGL